MPDYKTIAISFGWFELKRGWYHPLAEQYWGFTGYPVCYATAKELCEGEKLTDRAPDQGRMRMPKVEVVAGPCDIVANINGLPHMILRRSDVIAMQSYKKSVGTVETIYYIEFETKGRLIVSDYDDRGLWEDLLKGYGALKMFNHALGESERS